MQTETRKPEAVNHPAATAETVSDVPQIQAALGFIEEAIDAIERERRAQ